MPDALPLSRRLIAILLPHLPTDRLRRTALSTRRLPPGASTGGAPGEVPLAIVHTIANARRLYAVDKAAARLGLHPGLTLADAQARVPHLRVTEADAAADLATLRAIAAWCERWTPFVALSVPSGIVLDITGCAHLFGGEARLLQLIEEGLGAIGFSAQGAIAGTARAAGALACWRPGIRIEPGQEGPAVAQLPVAALCLDPETAKSLAYLGLTTIGALAARPRSPLAARFGAELITRLDEITGVTASPISPLRPLPLYVAERRFAEPMADQETALAVLKDLMREVCGVLERHAQGARRLEAAFFRSDGIVRWVEAATARPLRDPERLASLFKERLNALADPIDPGFGFDVIRLSVCASDPLTETQTAFDGAEEDSGLFDLVDILSARLGPRRVTRFIAGNSHVPEAAACMVAAQRTPGGAKAAIDWPAPAAAALPAARPLALFAKPEPVEALAEVPDGPPLRFRWRRVLHEVVRAEGPERIAPEWWRTQDGTLTRDYFRVEDHAGRRFWLYREGTYERETRQPRWFLHGVFA